MKLSTAIAVNASGTSEGAEKGWDVRGRGIAQEHVDFLKKSGFQPDSQNTSKDGFVTSFQHSDDNAHKATKQYFHSQGFSNTEGRSFMGHTGNPHVNLDHPDGRTVQVSWGRGHGTGVSFLKNTKQGN